MPSLWGRGGPVPRRRCIPYLVSRPAGLAFACLIVGRGNVGQLAPKWVFTTHGDVSATPTVADGVVYFPDFGGYLNAVNAKSGALIWQKRISGYDGTRAPFRATAQRSTATS
jgi:outer membrane protein assembly factor BamB